jgi:hypothetical protein
MKRLLTSFANILLSKEQMKAVKGGTQYCQSGNFGTVTCYYQNQQIGSVYGCCVTSMSDAACRASYGSGAYSQGCS